MHNDGPMNCGKPLPIANPDPAEQAYDPLKEFPNDLQAEQGVIASLVLAPEYWDDPRAPKLSRWEFFHEPERIIYGILENLRYDRKHIDAVSIVDALKAAGQYEQCGGAAYLGKILHSVANAAHLATYGGIVKKHAQRRQLKKLAAEVFQASGFEEPDDLIGRLENGLHLAKSAAGTGDDFELLTCADLDGGDFTTEFIIPDILAAQQSCIIAAPPKGMKTSITVDLGIAAATEGMFLGYFKVAKPVPCLIMSAESGMGTLQATARAVAHKARWTLDTIENLYWCSAVPQIGDVASMAKLCRAADRIHGGLLVIDPTYLALPAIDPGNLFAQGTLLRTLDEVCQPREITIVLVHHLKKTRAKEYDVPELAELSWSGFAEWARQWILLNRRERYEKPAPHRLWMSVGGSADHGGLWGIDIDQGAPGEVRSWAVQVRAPNDIRAEAKDDKGDRAKQISKAKQKQIEDDGLRVREWLVRQLPNGDTCRGVADGIRKPAMTYPRVKAALLWLEDSGVIEDCEVIKKDRATPRQGYRMKDGGPVVQVQTEPETTPEVADQEAAA